MVAHRTTNLFQSAGAGFLALALLAAPAFAERKKAPPATPQKLGEQRSTGHFDIGKIVWPNPPAIARVKFVDLFTGEKVDPNLFTKKNEKGKQKWMDRLAGTKTTDEIQIKDLPFQLIRPYGVAVDSKGLIYAADQGVSAVFIFNPETRAVELIGNGKQVHFGAISGLAIDDNDRLFVTDVGLHRVDVFAPGTHQLDTAFGGDVLANPSSIAIDTENRFLYVVDTQNDIVDVFDADTYKLLRKIGTPGKKHTLTNPGNFALPMGVAVDHDGNVYVADTFNNRVEIFDADGGFVSTFGKNGDGPQDFERPKGIAIDCDGHIWVTDSAQDRVKVFNQEGRLLIYFGMHGEYPGKFMGIHDIVIDKNNRVITSEIFPGRVQVFRYVTDAEADAEKKRREGEGDSKPAAPAKASESGSSSTKDSAVMQVK
ncbi:MAG TPA: 6-bladed beta-propeller [Candidatus Solibacter sp.]|nr:6-bladed beta-propeller [Candidatus Solibacter sp.]